MAKRSHYGMDKRRKELDRKKKADKKMKRRQEKARKDEYGNVIPETEGTEGTVGTVGTEEQVQPEPTGENPSSS